MPDSSVVRNATVAAVRIEQAGAVATIVLDNRHHRNAMTAAMWLALEPVCAALDADPTVAVIVVRGAGDTFSAGADISDLPGILHDPSTGHHDGGYVTRGENALANLGKPTIAAIDGYCVGGAWQIAGACDIRFASDRATFGITPSKIGIVYPLSGIERLVRLVGPATAKYLLFSGEFVTADEARSLGLVTRVVPQDVFWAEVAAFATLLTERSQLSIHAMKDVVDTIAAGSEGLADRNEFWQEQMAASDDAVIGIRAFLAKQAPLFTWAPPPA